MAGLHPEDADHTSLPPSELSRIDQRVANEAAARRVYYEGAAKWAIIVGTVGVTAHFAGNRFSPSYRKLYHQLKAMLVTSSFAVGWWVGGETAFQKWHRAEFNELANRKRRALKYMKEHREQFEDKIPVRSQPQMSPAAPSKGVVLPNVEASSPLP